MGGLKHLFDFHQGSMGRKHKKQSSADVAAPRKSLGMPVETQRSHYAVGDYEEGLSKRSCYPTDTSTKINKEISKQANVKQSAPSIVARLMGMDLVPVNTKSEVQPFRDKHNEVKFIDKKVQLIEKVSAAHAPKRSKSSSKKEYHSYKDTYFRYCSGMNSGKPRPRVHPQETELQQFKTDFEAWQAARFLECARAVQLGNIPEQWLAQLDLTKEKMSIYETSRKEITSKSSGHKSNMLKLRSLRGADFEDLGYKKDVFLDNYQHKESRSFSGRSPCRDLEQLSWKDSDVNSEKSSGAPSRIVILKPGPDSFSTNDESWITSSCTMDDRDCIEDLLEEVRERLKYEVHGNTFKHGSMVRGGGIETPFKEKPAYDVKETHSPVAKYMKENSSRDFSRKLLRSGSARSLQTGSPLSELAPSSPEYMSRETRKFLSERLRSVLDGEKHTNVRVSSVGSPIEPPLFDDARRRLEEARDILNAEKGNHFWHDGTYNADPNSRSFRRELSEDGNIKKQPSPRSLVRSLSAPVSGMSFGKLLLEDRCVSTGAQIKRKHEAFEKFPMDDKDQRKERFNLREKVSSLKHSLSLRRMLFSRNLETMELSDSKEFDSAKDILSGPTVINRFDDRNDNSTELPPSPASICSSPREEFWRSIDHPSRVWMSDVTSVESQCVGNVFKEISSNLTELQKQLNQLDYEGSEITTLMEDPTELEVCDLEDEAEIYIRNLLVTSGLYDGSWVQSFSTWDPFVKPMGNCVFDKVEELYPKPTDENEATSYKDTNLEHKLLFDLTNEALTAVLGPQRKLSKFRRKITEVAIFPLLQGRKLLEQVWEMVCEYLNPSSNTSLDYSFDDLVAHDLHITPWSSIWHEEMITLGKELESLITGDLVEELVTDMQV